MRDQIAMSKANGQLVIAVPLYRNHYEEEVIAGFEGYTFTLTNSKPLAYAIDCGDLGIVLMNAEFAKEHLEFLGDL